MNTAYLIPRSGLTVLQPVTHRHSVPTPLPVEGATVTLTSYWRRRIAVGDVTEGKAPAATKTTAKTTTTGA
jgi:hypothetical protein